MEKRTEPTQQTQPKKGKPVEIPVPKRKDVEDFIRGVSGPRPKKGQAPEQHK